MQLIIKLTGQRPLLMHNGRLANPMDKYTREISTISGKRSKTDEDRREDFDNVYDFDEGLCQAFRIEMTNDR